MRLKLEIPDYISIANFKKLHTLEHLSGFEKLIETIHMFTDIEHNEIRKWDINSISKIATDLTKPMDNENQFYPVLKFNDVEYGYSSIKSMTLGEYVDLERLCKEPVKNLESIAAILYRPIKSNALTTLKFQVKNGVQVARGKVENMFKYYAIEEYDVKSRDIRAEEFKDFPVQYINGALGFFLGSVTMSLNNTKVFSTEKEEKWMKMAERQLLNHLTNIGGGLRLFINSQKPTSLKSQVTKVLQK